MIQHIKHKLIVTCFEFIKGSPRLRLLELVEPPILLDMDPSNRWDNWCCWSAIDKACLCNNSSSAKSFLWDLPTLLLPDPCSFNLVSFLVLQMKLPISPNQISFNTHQSFPSKSKKNQISFWENQVFMLVKVSNMMDVRSRKKLKTKTKNIQNKIMDLKIQLNWNAI